MIRWGCDIQNDMQLGARSHVSFATWSGPVRQPKELSRRQGDDAVGVAVDGQQAQVHFQATSRTLR